MFWNMGKNKSFSECTYDCGLEGDQVGNCGGILKIYIKAISKTLLKIKKRHFPYFHTVIETRVEVWENEKLKSAIRMIFIGSSQRLLSPDRTTNENRRFAIATCNFILNKIQEIIM